MNLLDQVRCPCCTPRQREEIRKQRAVKQLPATINPKVSEYDPGDEWAEGEDWPTEKDISPPSADHDKSGTT